MSDNSSEDKLQQLFDLYKTGTITTEEFELLKAKLIGKDKNEHEPSKEIQQVPEKIIPPLPTPEINKGNIDSSLKKQGSKSPDLTHPAVKKRSADKKKKEKNTSVIPAVTAVGIIVVVTLILLLSGIFNSSNKTTLPPKSEQAPSATPIIVTSVTASSTMKPYKTYNYLPENVSDNDLQTWWSPVSSVNNGDPIWIKIDFGTSKNVSAVEILNGSHFPDYPKYGNLYTMNNRVTEARLEFSDGSNQIISLREADEIQRIEIVPKETSFIRLVPTKWTEGTWKDICISSFKAIGE